MLHSKSTKDQKTHDNLNSHRKSICQNPTSNPDLKKKKTSGNKKQKRTSPIWEKPSTHTDTHGHTHTPPKTVNIILNGEKLECFPPKIKNKSRISTLITSTEHCTYLNGLVVFPTFLQFKCEFGNKEFMIWATVRMAIFKKSTNNKCWRGCGERESYTVG